MDPRIKSTSGGLGRAELAHSHCTADGPGASVPGTSQLFRRVLSILNAACVYMCEDPRFPTLSRTHGRAEDIVQRALADS